METRSGSTSSVAVFPRASVDARLREALCHLEADTSAMRDEWDPTFDSLAVVNILCCIDEVLPGLDFAPEKVVRKGGYKSLDDAADHLLHGVQRAWEKANA